MRLVETAPVIEGQSIDICVVFESENAQRIEFEVNVTLNIISDNNSAGMCGCSLMALCAHAHE